MRDIKNKLDAVTTIFADDHITNSIGNGVDLLGFDAAMVAFSVNYVQGGPFTILVQESKDGQTWNDVSQADLDGELFPLARDVDQRVGYVGTKRFLRGILNAPARDEGQPAPVARVAAMVVRGFPHRSPATHT